MNADTLVKDLTVGQFYQLMQEAASVAAAGDGQTGPYESRQRMDTRSVRRIVSAAPARSSRGNIL